jgi:hypothetical protein
MHISHLLFTQAATDRHGSCLVHYMYDLVVAQLITPDAHRAAAGPYPPLPYKHLRPLVSPIIGRIYALVSENQLLFSRSRQLLALLN